MMTFSRLTYVLGCLLVLAVSGSSFATPFTSLEEIRALSAEKAAAALPVLVEGQILWNHPEEGGFFLYADGIGIYASGEGRQGDWNLLPVGEMVRIEGGTSEGRFTPCILIEQVEALGVKPLPEAEPFYLHQMYSTNQDCKWVQIKGRLESMRVHRKQSGLDRIELEIASYGHSLSVQVPLTEGAEEKVKALMFCRVQFNAVTGTLYNMTRQMLGRTFFVSSADVFEAADDYAPTEELAVRPIHELIRSGDNLRRPVRTQGLVTHVEGQHIYLRGEKACLQVSVQNKPDVRVGDYVELEGFAVLRPLGPVFLAREIRVVEHRTPPQPVKLQLTDELRARWDQWPDTGLNRELVQVDAQLVDVSETFGLSTGRKERILLCRQGSYLFETRLPAELELDGRMAPGAVLRLTGICNLTRSLERRYKLFVDGIWIQARNAGDIEVVVAAPWWTTRKMFWMLGILLGIAGLALVWVAALRRTVESQTVVIAEKVQQESILNERQRIARELHDSLAQGLAGIALQMKGCGTLLESGADKSNVRKALSVMQQTLEYCSTESRNLIFDLRGGLLERMDLSAALEETLQPLALECGAKVEISVVGKMRRLKLRAERNLLLIAKEAATNAARHAAPGRIGVVLNYEPNRFVLSIEDDGCGFDAERQPPLGHFGLRGMRERVNKLGGTILVESEADKGTAVRVELAVEEEGNVR